ncbi:MAG: hypothetical protein L3K08_03380, partial [Thermoplasmata archaeon]|nr:hypothetical protein [Thermoplasmata archaeon]
TWDGPAWYTCPGGSTGSLEYVPHGAIDKPNLNNPTLLAAFRQIGFGPILLNQVAGGTDRPMFLFVPGTSISVAPNPDWATSCYTPTGYSPNCERDPTLIVEPTFGWNWSTNASRNVLYIGDEWTAQFNIIANGPSGVDLPVDACDLLACRTGGAAPRGGAYTSAEYLAYANTTTIDQSFPLATLQVQAIPSAGGFAQPPGLPPPPPPGIAIPASAPLTVSNPQLLVVQSPIGTASLQGIAASALAAGFTRMSVKNKPVAVSVAALTGNGGPKTFRSRFDH